jgi:hypothetical protein
MNVGISCTHVPASGHFRLKAHSKTWGGETVAQTVLKPFRAIFRLPPALLG